MRAVGGRTGYTRLDTGEHYIINEVHVQDGGGRMYRLIWMEGAGGKYLGAVDDAPADPNIPVWIDSGVVSPMTGKIRQHPAQSCVWERWKRPPAMGAPQT